MFSVVIPTYNRADLLKECLQSLVDQTFKDFEVLVCDDGSTDNTVEIVTSFNSQLAIQYLLRENSGGPAAPRNLGITHARHDWICFLDSDDYWTRDKLQVLSEYIYKEESFNIFCHLTHLIDNNNNKIGLIGRYKKFLELNDFKSLVYNGNQIVHSSIVVRRSVINEHFLFETSHDYHGIEDFIFLLKLTYVGNKVLCVPINLGFYRWHGSNISADSSRQIAKKRKYFATKPFINLDYSKINGLLRYVEIISTDFDRSERIRHYFVLLLTSDLSTFIRIKCFYKLMESILIK
jgi:glycosyltransferase involved in cell wall biosynthesis